MDQGIYLGQVDVQLPGAVCVSEKRLVCHGVVDGNVEVGVVWDGAGAVECGPCAVGREWDGDGADGGVGMVTL